MEVFLLNSLKFFLKITLGSMSIFNCEFICNEDSWNQYINKNSFKLFIKLNTFVWKNLHITHYVIKREHINFSIGWFVMRQAWTHRFISLWLIITNMKVCFKKNILFLKYKTIWYIYIQWLKYKTTPGCFLPLFKMIYILLWYIIKHHDSENF